MKNENQRKKPFYKRWWFIALVVIFVIGSIGNIIDPSDSKTTTATESSSKSIKPKLTLNKSSVSTDSEGVAIISGKTDVDASVTVGITHTTKSNSKGKFKISYDLTSPKKKVVNITVTKDGSTTTDTVTVKPSKTYIAKNKKANKIKTAAKKTERKNKTKSSSSKYDFSKISLGMTQEQVISLLGQPTSQSKIDLWYGDDDLNFDSSGKLYDGSPANIKKAANTVAAAQKSSEKKQDKVAADSSSKQSDLSLYARTFGQKDVETLQKYGSSVYPSTKVSTGMMYGYKSPAGMLYRVDTTSNNITTVYKDNGSGDLGDILYQGRTIVQKQHNTYILQ